MMQMTGTISIDSLMSLEAYSKYRKAHKADVMAHRKLRSVQLGEHLNLQFEVQLQIKTINYLRVVREDINQLVLVLC